MRLALLLPVAGYLALGCGRETLDFTVSPLNPAPRADAGTELDAASHRGDAGCAVDCAARGEVCSQGSCVDCETDQDCGPFLPRCDTLQNRCVLCVSANDCPPELGLCEPHSGRCVQCFTSADCASRAAPGSRPLVCNYDLCFECATDTDCGGSEPFCQPILGRCVACVDSSECPGGESCNLITGTCEAVSR